MRGKGWGLRVPAEYGWGDLKEREDEDVAGRPATRSWNPADLSPCVVGRPVDRAWIYEAIGIAEWRYF